MSLYRCRCDVRGILKNINMSLICVINSIMWVRTARTWEKKATIKKISNKFHSSRSLRIQKFFVSFSSMSNNPSKCPTMLNRQLNLTKTTSCSVHPSPHFRLYDRHSTHDFTYLLHCCNPTQTLLLLPLRLIVTLRLTTECGNFSCGRKFQVLPQRLSRHTLVRSTESTMLLVQFDQLVTQRVKEEKLSAWYGKRNVGIYWELCELVCWIPTRWFTESKLLLGPDQELTRFFC